MQIHGPILTQCSSLDQVAATMRRGGYTALKVITGWGSPAGWTREAMTRVASIAPHLIVRTVAGDPSYNRGSHDQPTPERVVAELGPWYTIRKDMLIELGNEPNIDAAWSEDFAWVYRWNLDRTIAACRAAFPQAKLIAPALILDEARRPRRWLEIVSDVMRRCDYVGVHVYEFDAWLASEQRHGSTGQLELARRLHTAYFPDRAWLITEYGIHDPATLAATKGRRYAAMLKRLASTPTLPKQVQGALYYHLCFDGSLQPEYHIAPEGDVAYKKTWEGR